MSSAAVVFNKGQWTLRKMSMAAFILAAKSPQVCGGCPLSRTTDTLHHVSANVRNLATAGTKFSLKM